jgi:hypothetical protein
VAAQGAILAALADTAWGGATGGFYRFVTIAVTRTEGRVKCSVWDDEDFAPLPDRSKLLYLFLLSQRDMTMSGLIPVRQSRWSLRLGWSAKVVEDNLAQLDAARFVIVDIDQGEAWVRTMIRHEGIADQPRWLAAAQRSFAEAASPKIKSAFVSEYPDLAVAWHVNGIVMPFDSHAITGNREQVTGNTERGTLPTARAREAEVAEVFEAWRVAAGRSGRTRLGGDRRRRIRARLDEYPLEDVIDAVVGVTEHSWNREHGYTDLGLALRDGAHVERYRDIHRGLLPRSDPKRLGAIDRDLKDRLESGSVDDAAVRYAFELDTANG